MLSSSLAEAKGWSELSKSNNSWLGRTQGLVGQLCGSSLGASQASWSPLVPYQPGESGTFKVRRAWPLACTPFPSPVVSILPTSCRPWEGLWEAEQIPEEHQAEAGSRADGEPHPPELSRKVPRSTESAAAHTGAGKGERAVSSRDRLQGCLADGPRCEGQSPVPVWLAAFPGIAI